MTNRTDTATAIDQATARRLARLAELPPIAATLEGRFPTTQGTRTARRQRRRTIR